MKHQAMALRWLVGLLVIALVIHIAADFHVYSELRKAQNALANQCLFLER